MEQQKTTFRDLQTTIMQERVIRGVRIVKEEAEANNINFDKDLLIKGIEVGISLFIQKERNSPNTLRDKF